MNDIHVISENELTFQGKTFRCAIGKNGFARGQRKEGSGTTPVGRFALRECWYRPDRMEAPLTVLPLRAMEPNDGWCDEPSHALYNRHVKLPFAASHENLWREDSIYDLIVPIGFNDDPVTPGKGSAIFLHIATPDYSGTEGCIALEYSDMEFVLAELNPETQIIILG